MRFYVDGLELDIQDQMFYMDLHGYCDMKEHEKIENILAFLCILFGEDNDVWQRAMNLSPEYIIEKFERYVLSSQSESGLGMHPLLRDNVFNQYSEKWSLEEV